MKSPKLHLNRNKSSDEDNFSIKDDDSKLDSYLANGKETKLPVIGDNKDLSPI
jgi:hypothetical protein